MRSLAERASGLGEVSLGLLLPIVTVGLMFAANCGAPDVVRRAQPAGGSGGESSSSSSEGTAGVAGSTASTPPEGGTSNPGSAGSSGGPGGTSVAGGAGAAGGASATGGKGGAGGAGATGGKGGTSTSGKGGASATGGKGGGGGAGGYIGASGITTSPFAGNGGGGGMPDTSAGGTGAVGGAGGTIDTTPVTPLPTDALAAYVVQTISGKTGEIDLNLRIDNKTANTVDMSTVTLRYWYQDEGLGASLQLASNYVSIGYSNTGGGKVTAAKAVAASASSPGADHYLEFSFSGTLAVQGDKTANGQVTTNDQFTMQVAVHTGNYQGAVDVTNDYSYNGGKTGYDTKITLYQNGKLIAGVEPGKG
jgi:Cellulose binding domain